MKSKTEAWIEVAESDQRCFAPAGCEGFALKRVIDRYRRTLEKVIRVQRIILYGSYAYGKPHDGSDIDLAVISRDFRRMLPLERWEFLSLACRESKAPIEALSYRMPNSRRLSNRYCWTRLWSEGLLAYEAWANKKTRKPHPHFPAPPFS